MAHTTTDLAQIQDIIRNGTPDGAHLLVYNGNGSQFCKIDRMTRNYGNIPLKCRLYRDYEKTGDGIYWLLQSGVMLKAHYSKHDLWERKMFEEAPTIENGKVYYILDMTKAPEVFSITKTVAQVNGDYSNAAVFNPVDF